jgi:hypothetical protein
VGLIVGVQLCGMLPGIEQTNGGQKLVPQQTIKGLHPDDVSVKSA